MAIDYFLLYISDDDFNTFTINGNRIYPSDLPFTVSGLAENTAYKGKLKAVDELGRISPFSDIFELTTEIFLTAPVLSSPTGITSSGFSCSWGSVTNATSYRVDVSLDNFVTNVVAYDNLQVFTNSVSVTGLNANTSYKIRVRSEANGQVSENSSSQTALTLLSTVTLNSASGITSTGFTVNWNSVTGATSYKLDVATDSGFNTLVVNNQTVTGTSYSVTGLSANTNYYVRMKAVNGTNDGSYSTTQTNLTLLTTPTLSSATNVTTASFTANWVSVTGATSYKLTVSTDLAGNSPVSGYNNKTVAGTSDSVTGLSPNTAYYWKVQAVNGTNDSIYSSPSTTTTASLTDVILIASNHTGIYQKYLLNTSGSIIENIQSDNYDTRWSRISPDGQKVIIDKYVGAKKDLFVKDYSDIAGTAGTFVFSNAEDKNFATFNGNRSKMLFTNLSDLTKAYTVNSDGTNLTLLFTEASAMDSTLSYSRDGNYLMYSYKTALHYALYRRNADGTNKISLTTVDAFDEIYGNFSPDSTKIVFQARNLAGTAESVYYANVDGTGKTQIISPEVSIDTIRYPILNTDNTKLYYSYLTGGIWKIYRSDINGANNALFFTLASTNTFTIDYYSLPINDLSVRVGKYLFSSNANSQNGLYNGTLAGSATATGGVLTIPNDATSYLKIPAGLINIASELTITAKVKINTLHTSSGQYHTLFTAPRYNQVDNFMLFYDAFNNRWTYRHTGTTDVNFSSSTIEDGAYHFICFQVKLGSGSYSKVFIDDMATPLSTGANSLTLLDSNFFLFGQDVDSWGATSPYTPQGFDINQSWAGNIQYLNIETRILNTSELNALKTEAGF